ncbi:MAG: hypothetical protein ACM30I_07520 [Gemmatimonas sp.]
MVQLTPLSPVELARALDVFAAGLDGDALAAAAFATIRASRVASADERTLLAAVADLAHRFGIPTIDEEPARAFSWDGRALRIRSEACVLFHEIAHWQLAPAARRGLPDFGLGAGPETGRKSEADAARAIDEPARIDEECAASILGILWEAACGGPAIDAFLEQNWLERFDSTGTHRLFAATVRALHARGLIDGAGRPFPPPAAGDAAAPELTAACSRGAAGLWTTP